MCFFTLLFSKNLLLQTWQACNFTPIWICSCSCKWPLFKNLFPHVVQTCGLSEYVWVILCLCNCEHFEKLLPHSWKLCGLLAVWIVLCCNTVSRLENLSVLSTLLFLFFWTCDLFLNALQRLLSVKDVLGFGRVRLWSLSDCLLWKLLFVFFLLGLLDLEFSHSYPAKSWLWDTGGGKENWCSSPPDTSGFQSTTVSVRLLLSPSAENNWRSSGSSFSVNC